MKITILAVAIVACALTAPSVSAQQMPAPEGSAMSMDQRLSQMQEHIKKCNSR